MTARSEYRFKENSLQRFHSMGDAKRELEVLAHPRKPRQPMPRAKTENPTRASVRRWFRLHGLDCDNLTTAVECCVSELGAPESWLDDPDHWVWEIGLNEWPED